MKSWKKMAEFFFPLAIFKKDKKWFQQTNNENKKIDCVYDCCACRYSSHTHILKGFLKRWNVETHRHRFPSPSCLYSVIYRMMLYMCYLEIVISFHYFISFFWWCWKFSMMIIINGGGSRWRQLYPVMFNDGGGELSSGKTNQTNKKKMKKWKN